ncbi:hypothetical protein [Nocardioides sp. W7]|uniref:hypothetical protein n=1 Tax=Nocardioides sp. W7 TaxID=2931390 RepID=UPI001FD3B0B4|nr:hypothetical protein [Nocardioides sp. W7]
MTAEHDPDDEQTRELGERLATWLEGLGLASYLPAAGLPVLDRDPDGRAVWTDPGTRRPMTGAQLAEVERLLRQDGSEPEHAVPISLVQLARRAKVREQLLASAWFGYETLAEVRGASVEATRFAVHKAASSHRLLVVAANERTLVPGFQLTMAGEVRPELVPVLEPLLASRMDPWQVWGWLTQPAALLGGLVPERAVLDPEEAAVVLHAAVRLAERK